MGVKWQRSESFSDAVVGCAHTTRQRAHASIKEPARKMRSDELVNVKKRTKKIFEDELVSDHVIHWEGEPGLASDRTPKASWPPERSGTPERGASPAGGDPRQCRSGWLAQAPGGGTCS